MSVVSAASIAAKPMEYLANLVASSTTFRAIAQADDADVALQRIYWPEASDRLNADGQMEHPRPRCIIRPGTDHEIRRRGPGEWADNGNLELCFEFLVPDVHRNNIKDSLFWFVNQYGAILNEMMTNRDAGSDATPYLSVTRFGLFAGPDYPDADDDPDGDGVYAVSYLVSWV